MDGKTVAKVKALIQEKPGIDLPELARSVNALYHSDVEAIVFWLLRDGYIREAIQRRPPAFSSLEWIGDKQ